MAVPVHLGARVTMSDDQAPTAFTTYDFEDSSGRRWTEAARPGVNLDVTPFVHLDDGRRIEVEPFGVSIGLHTHEQLEQMIRESVFEDDIREVAETDPEVAEWPFELDEIVAALERRGVRSDAAGLRALAFVVELDGAVEARLEGGAG